MILTVSYARPTVLHAVDSWLEQWRRPVWESVYLNKRAACNTMLEQARTALGTIPDHLDSEVQAVVGD